MNNNQLLYQVALSFLKGIGSKRAKTLIAYLGSLDKIFDNHTNLRTAVPGFSKEGFRKLNRSEALKKAEIVVEEVKNRNIKTVFFTDKNYPKWLKECPDSPILLYYQGDFDFNHQRTIAIVGTRNMTSYGQQLINEFIVSLAPFNIQVISGLAYGVDGYAHKCSIQNDIPTIGVLGHGLDRIYPHQHRSLAKKMIDKKGCGLLTEFPTGTIPDRENFPQRNRIVAGMSAATIVIESGKKGGSLITANLANDYNRDVFTFPGNVNSPYSIGCNQLIADDKAHLITKGSDFIRMMGWEKEKQVVRAPDLFSDLNTKEQGIVNTIKMAGKIPIDVLSLKVQEPISKLNALLLQLELKGKVMALPGKFYSLY